MVKTRLLALSALSLIWGLSGCGTQANSSSGSSTLRAYVAWGDSLTEGHEGWIDVGEYPQDLQGMLTQPSMVANEGIGGETSTQIGVREGGILTTVSVSGGSIPASGPVQVSFPPGYEPITGPGHELTGTILGVYGTVTWSSPLAGPIFTRSKDGDQVDAPNAEPFVVDTTYSTGSSFIPVFWEGRNDPRGSEAQLQATIDNISKQVTASKSPVYLVMSVINGNYEGEQRGGNGYNKIIELNSRLASLFANHYLDIRKILVSSYDPSSAVDVTDHNNDEPPTSLHAVDGTGSLAGPIGPNDTTFAVNLTAGYLLRGDLLTIGTGSDAENVRVLAVSGSNVTVVRNAGGNKESHPAGTQVLDDEVLHLNSRGYQIVADAVAAWCRQQH